MTPATQRRLQTLFLLLTLTAALMGSLLALFPAAGHDQLWFLMMARRWLAGAELYGPEVFDSNPPGIVWVSAIPVWLGGALHVAATLPAKLLVLFAEAFSGWLCFRLLRRWSPELSTFQAMGLLFVYVVLTLAVPARDFGQRDQLLSFLILPYVLAAVIDAGFGLRCAVGLLAAAGICLKPQYALIPLLVEAVMLFRAAGGSRLRRIARPETVLIVVIGVLYLAAIHHTAPLYFSFALPVLRETYWAVGHLSLPQLIWQAIELTTLAVLAIGMYVARSPRSLVVFALLLAGSAAFTAYLIQGTGWYYQQIPAITLFGAALGLELLEFLPERVPGWLVPFVASLCVLALGLTTHFMNYPFTQDRSFAIEVPDPALFAGLPAGTPIAMLTTSVDATMMPVERYGLMWGQRTNNLWTLPAILRSENAAGSHLMPEQLSTLETMQHRWMVEDLQRWRPQLILVQRCQDAAARCQLLEDRSDDLLAWFERDPAFRTAWSSYKFVRHSGPFDVYVLPH